jgi:hypothetical protein
MTRVSSAALRTVTLNWKDACQEPGKYHSGHTSYKYCKNFDEGRVFPDIIYKTFYFIEKNGNKDRTSQSEKQPIGIAEDLIIGSHEKDIDEQCRCEKEVLSFT